MLSPVVCHLFSHTFTSSLPLVEKLSSHCGPSRVICSVCRCSNVVHLCESAVLPLSIRNQNRRNPQRPSLCSILWLLCPLKGQQQWAFCHSWSYNLSFLWSQMEILVQIGWKKRNVSLANTKWIIDHRWHELERGHIVKIFFNKVSTGGWHDSESFL